MPKIEEVEPKLGDEIPQTWLDKAQKEINSEYRTVIVDEFRGKKDVELRIFQPDPGVDSEAQDAYAKTYNRLLKDPDLLTRKQVEKIMKDKDIWGEVQQNRIDKLTEDMRGIELTVAKMRKKGNWNKASMNKLRISWKKKRTEINGLSAEKINVLANCIEGRAEEEEIKVKLFLCVKDSENNLVWSSLDELNKETNRIVLARLINDSILFWSGLTQEIIDELPVKLLFDGEKISENLQEA